jgi:ABC-type transport system substrate-binding protein
MAISRDDIVSAAYSKYATPTDTVFSTQSVWNPKRTFPTKGDMAGAKALVASSGVDISNTTVKILEFEPSQVQETQLVAATWKQLGFKDVTIKTVERAQIVQELGGADWDANVVKPSASVVPDRIYGYYDPKADWRYALSGFCDSSQIVSLLDQGRKTTDTTARRQAYESIDQIGNKDLACSFYTIREQQFIGMRSNVAGWQQDQMATQWSWWHDGGILTAYLKS